MRSFLLIVLLTLSACASKDVEKKVEQHNVILSAMVEYFGDLQAKGVLPKPEQKEVKQVSMNK